MCLPGRQEREGEWIEGMGKRGTPGGHRAGRRSSASPLHAQVHAQRSRRLLRMQATVSGPRARPGTAEACTRWAEHQKGTLLPPQPLQGCTVRDAGGGLFQSGIGRPVAH